MVRGFSSRRITGEGVLDLARQRGEAAVVERRRRVVDRARADHEEKARVGALEDALDGVAAGEHGAPRGLRERQLVVQRLGRDELDLARRR